MSDFHFILLFILTCLLFVILFGFKYETKTKYYKYDGLVYLTYIWIYDKIHKK